MVIARKEKMRKVEMEDSGAESDDCFDESILLGDSSTRLQSSAEDEDVIEAVLVGGKLRATLDEEDGRTLTAVEKGKGRAFRSEEPWWERDATPGPSGADGRGRGRPLGAKGAPAIRSSAKRQEQRAMRLLQNLSKQPLGPPQQPQHPPLSRQHYPTPPPRSSARVAEKLAPPLPFRAPSVDSYDEPSPPPSDASDDEDEDPVPGATERFVDEDLRAEADAEDERELGFGGIASGWGEEEEEGEEEVEMDRVQREISVDSNGVAREDGFVCKSSPALFPREPS